MSLRGKAFLVWKLPKALPLQARGLSKKRVLSLVQTREVEMHTDSKRIFIDSSWCFFLTVVAVSLCGIVTRALAAESVPSPTASKQLRYVKGRLLVQPRAGLAAKDFDRILADHGGRRAQHLSQINTYIVELPEGTDEAAVAKA